MSDAGTWMPIYIGDYLADTMHLEAAEHGAYLLLIMHYWRNGPLPDDDRALAAIARTDRKTWVSETGPVVRAFFEAKNGRLHHKRIESELAKAKRNSSKRREAANARWKQKESTGDANADAHGDANASANASGEQSKRNDPRVRSPSPSPSPDSSELRSGASPSAAAPPVDPPPIRERLWQDGIPILVHLTGKPEKACRAFLGKCLQAAQDDCARVYRVMLEAQSMRPADPMAWISAACGESRTNRKPSRVMESMAALAGIDLLHPADPDEPPTIEHNPDAWRSTL